jgi:two-component system response regulator AtoC
MSFEIMIVDDEAEVCLSLGELLNSKGYGVHRVEHPEEVMPLLEREPIDLIIMDVRMPSIGGIDLLKLVRQRHALLPVLMISGYASVENAVRAMKYGALNFYTKPIRLPDLLREIRHLEHSVRFGRPKGEADRIATSSPTMKKVLSLVEKAAPTEASVIIMGESGTGKELVADLLNEGSPRRANAYIKINCAAIPDNLLESEMFGYEKGAFTDAQQQQQGKFELADGGTLFLDEIGDMSLKTQAKMLRVLQEKRFTRLGGSKPIKTDFRVIAASNHSLEQMIKEGTFREDLYYRLSVIVLQLPPLRERREDIVPIAEEFVRSFSGVYGKQVFGLSPAVADVLQKHSWPGNVRELRNIIERAVIFCEGDTIELGDLPEQYKILTARSAASPEDLTEAAADGARAVILEALKRTNGVKGEAARLLNITRKTLYNRMKRLHLG